MTLKPQTRVGLWVGAWLAAALAAIVGLLQVPVLAVPGLLAFALAFVLEPAIIRWESYGNSRGSALILIGFGFAALLLAAVFFLPPWAQKQWTLLSTQAPAALDRLRQLRNEANGALGRYAMLPQSVRIPDLSNQALAFLKTDVLPALPGVVGEGAVGIVMIPVFTFFLLADGRRARKAVLERIPNRHFEMALNIFHRIGKETGAYMRGVCLEGALVGLVAWVVLVLFSVPGAFVIALVVGITNIISYVGPLAGAAFGLLYCLFIAGTNAAFAGVIAAILISQLADNVLIGPLVIGKALNVHALLVILLLVVGGKLFGVIGLVVAVPLWVIVRVVFQETASAARAYSRHMID